MSVWESPAKVNLSLEVGPRESNGYHPLRSLVMCVDWCDLIRFEEADEDQLVITGADQRDAFLELERENLIWRAIGTQRKPDGHPQLHIELDKSIAVAAGLGGGSSNAAAALAAWADLTGSEVSAESAQEVGSDVSFFLRGGLQRMEGFGERLTKVKTNPELAVAVVVPPFELNTGDVYQRWDRLGEPKGPSIDGRQLPPPLRELGPFRNDLTAAAIEMRPELGDYIQDLRERWSQPVLMSGSGPALYSWFADEGEAEGAIAVAPKDARSSSAARPRPNGVDRIE